MREIRPQPQFEDQNMIPKETSEAGSLRERVISAFSFPRLLERFRTKSESDFEQTGMDQQKISDYQKSLDNVLAQQDEMTPEQAEDLRKVGINFENLALMCQEFIDKYPDWIEKTGDKKTVKTAKRGIKTFVKILAPASKLFIELLGGDPEVVKHLAEPAMRSTVYQIDRAKSAIKTKLKSDQTTGSETAEENIPATMPESATA